MTEFDPQGTEVAARRDNPGLDEAMTRRESEQQKYLAPVIAYFDILEAEITKMPISARYRRDKSPDLSAAIGGPKSFSPLVTGLNEAEFRRAQLLDLLQKAKSSAMAVIGDIGDLVMSMESTRRD